MRWYQAISTTSRQVVLVQTWLKYMHEIKVSVNFKQSFCFYDSIGYCPQMDALYNKLTGTELLDCYAKIKGLTGKQREQVSSYKITTTTKMSTFWWVSFKGKNRLWFWKARVSPTLWLSVQALLW